MKACLQSPTSRGHVLAAPRSCCAPALLAAYAIGATLWAPAFVIVAGPFEAAAARFMPGLSFAGATSMFAVMWALRFALYVIGSYARWDYGYGINGVIVNRQLTLPEKTHRIARDWFGVMLIAVWLCFMAAAVAAMIAGR